METTRNEMTPYSKTFFDKLRTYLDTKLYFYGSIQRNDYFPSHSDIDVDIFTHNIDSVVYKIQNFLDIDKEKIKRFVLKINDTIVVGKKIIVKRPDHNFRAEISIFEEKYKELVLYEHNRKNDLPIIIGMLVYILKFLYYQLNVIDRISYKKTKQFLLNSCFDDGYLEGYFNKDSKPNFVVLDITKKT